MAVTASERSHRQVDVAQETMIRTMPVAMIAIAGGLNGEGGQVGRLR